MKKTTHNSEEESWVLHDTDKDSLSLFIEHVDAIKRLTDVYVWCKKKTQRKEFQKSSSWACNQLQLSKRARAHGMAEEEDDNERQRATMMENLFDFHLHSSLINVSHSLSIIVISRHRLHETASVEWRFFLLFDKHTKRKKRANFNKNAKDLSRYF